MEQVRSIDYVMGTLMSMTAAASLHLSSLMTLNVERTTCDFETSTIILTVGRVV